ncbi:MAG: VWA domain-containing protein, partial [Vicinamibacterales bacterium]
MAVPREMLHYVAMRVAEHDVQSLRADLAVVRASRAHAAFDGAEAVTAVHVETVLPLALAHRTPAKSRSRTPPPSPQRSDDQSRQNDQQPTEERARERVFETTSVAAPQLTVEHAGHRTGRAAGDSGPVVGPIVASRRSDTPREMDLRPSLIHAVTHTGVARIRVEDLHERVRTPRASTRFILIVDSSGSHAIQDRMRLVKGAVSGLLEASHGRHDEVVVITCRGAEAQVLVEPTSSREDADRALDYLPTGGRTPLAHGLEL